MRTIVKPTRYKQGDEQKGNRNLPNLSNPSRRSFWHSRRARACRRKVPTLRVALQPLQIRSHVGCVLITQIAVFLQSLVDDLFQLGRHVGIQSHGRNRCPVQDRIEDGGCTVPTKWQLAGGHLIEDSSKREQIRSCI